MLTADLSKLYDWLEQFKEALLKNRVTPFRKETPEKRGFRIGCVNRAQFNIQNHHIPATTSGRANSPANGTRMIATITEIWNSGFFEWSKTAAPPQILDALSETG